MFNQLTDREQRVLRHLGDQVQSVWNGGLAMILLGTEDIARSACALGLTEADFRRSVGLLEHSGYLMKSGLQGNGLEIELTMQGYVAYCGDAFPTFFADREAIERAIVMGGRGISNVDIEQRLGLPPFEVSTVFGALLEERLITAFDYAGSPTLWQVESVSPVLEEQYL